MSVDHMNSVMCHNHDNSNIKETFQTVSIGGGDRVTFNLGHYKAHTQAMAGQTGYDSSFIMHQGSDKIGRMY